MKQLLRMAASLTATVLGSALLIADGDECGHYDAFKGSASYTANCGEIATGAGAFTLDLPASSIDSSRWDDAKQQLGAGGLHVSRVNLGYTGTCGADEGHYSVDSITLYFKDAIFKEYKCDELPLPVTTEQQVSCTRAYAPSETVEPLTCNITFRPLQK